MKELEKVKSVRHSAQELKQYFLDNAEPLVKQYIDAAIGTGKLEGTNAEAREQVWDVLKKLMLQSSDKLDIKIEKAQDVIDAVSTGKCTMDEGKQLLSLYKQMSDIDNAGKLGQLGEGGGLTINILAATQPQEIIETEPAYLEKD